MLIIHVVGMINLRTRPIAQGPHVIGFSKTEFVLNSWVFFGIPLADALRTVRKTEGRKRRRLSKEAAEERMKETTQTYEDSSEGCGTRPNRTLAGILLERDRCKAVGCSGIPNVRRSKCDVSVCVAPSRI